ncbi:transcriptional regulator, AraC family [Cnuella takakiae]|uniref:Transcriptional regulator, AraC family n=1 Tax=Cnuella takakiae TaxID=1302690 RepID=A0A1M5CNA5_9BACT|nr:helix-turn-helix transcriptional regulator [Cnuella takakiae]OLY91886.1 AraC family transcriptional regulator [Cnuella takakiae]SHF56201.1 transcriptional regulator, AraC family [Cnuella takakiae]
MAKVETLEDYYKNKYGWLPDNLRNEIGHFNVFRLEPYLGQHARPVPYRKRDYYKVMLVLGHGKVHYADKAIEVQKQALSFSNPQIPYSWERDEIHSGVFCIFDRNFFRQFGNLEQYAVFQPGGTPVLELTDEQVERVQGIFTRMFEEIGSDYVHKYDVLRTLVYELLHLATRLQPCARLRAQPVNAAQRISVLFLELLERQFPIDDPAQCIGMRAASDFADKLNVHVNHLNRAIKETTQKTTSQIIGERILQEAKVLLKHSSWSVSEIAYALGFKEATHFNNFFKKNTELSPLRFRSV